MIRLRTLMSLLPLLAGCEANRAGDTDEPPTRPPPEFLEPRDTIVVPSSRATTTFVHDDVYNAHIEGAVFAGDLDGDGLPNIVGWGIRYPRTSEIYLFGSSLPAIAHPSDGVLLEGPAGDGGGADLSLLRPSATHDVSGDGVVDLVLPYADLYGGIRVSYGPLPATNTVLPTDASIVSDITWSSLSTPTYTGDIDGDGIADVSLVGGTTTTSEWGIYVLNGPISGTLDIADADATVSYEDGLFGLSSPEDIDGDGYADLLVGYAGYGGTDSTNAEGAAWLMRGPLNGDRDVTEADAMMIGEGGGDSVGYQMEFVGDVDGDGKGDILIGSESFDGGWNYSAYGGAWLVLGVPSGTLDLEDADAHLLGYRECGGAGLAVAGAGDVDADGFADVWVSTAAHQPGCGDSAALVRGPVEGNLWLSGPDIVVKALYAVSLDGSADYDGDGRNDLLAADGGAGASLFTGPWE